MDIVKINEPLSQFRKIQVADALRGLACLAVMLYHFSGRELYRETVFAGWGRYGSAGVEVFFVLSGFVIPLSMFARSFRLLPDTPAFLLRRTLRVYPAYLASIVLSLALAYVSSLLPGFRGEIASHSIQNLTSHLWLVNDVLGLTWVNPVYWTLAIEAQYYLMIPFIYEFIFSEKRLLRYGVIACLCTMALLIPGKQWLAMWLPEFLLGTVTLRWFLKFDSILEWLILAGVQVACLAILDRGVISIVASLLTALILAWNPQQIPLPLKFVGIISYSLYLIHEPIGCRLVRLGERLPQNSLVQILILATAILLSVISAWVWYRCFEHPVLKRKIPSKLSGPKGAVDFFDRAAIVDYSEQPIELSTVNEGRKVT